MRKKSKSAAIRLMAFCLCLAALGCNFPTATVEPPGTNEVRPATPSAVVPEATLTTPTEGTPTSPPATHPPASPTPRPETGLAALPITFPIMNSEMAAYFNQIARLDDIALIPANRLELVSQITAGRKRVGFASWSEAESELSRGSLQVDIVAYNPEHWPQTPASEQDNLPATVQQAAEFAHQRGVLLMVSPDRRFAQEYLSQIAPYADLIGLQGQRLQADPQVFASWAQGMIQMARGANPDVQIFVQVGATQGPAEEMLAAIQTVADQIDGISIWTNTRTFPILQEFVSLLRPN